MSHLRSQAARTRRWAVLIPLLFLLVGTADSAASASQAVTVTFDDRAGQNQALDGQYPTGVIDWGTGQWFHSAPWRKFTTKSVSFRTSSQRSATFTFVNPTQLLELKAFNGGSATTV